MTLRLYCMVDVPTDPIKIISLRGLWCQVQSGLSHFLGEAQSWSVFSVRRSLIALLSLQ